MTRDDQLYGSTILADYSPADFTVSTHGSRAIDGMNVAHRAFSVLDEIPAVLSDRKSAPSIEDNIDDVVARVPGDQRSHKIRVKVSSLNMGV